MTCYYLLRNNNELGPYTITELRAMELFTTDLIWINGQSTCWTHPDETEGFEGLAKAPVPVPRQQIPARQTTTENPALPSSAEEKKFEQTEAVQQANAAAEPAPSLPRFQDLQIKYAAKPKRRPLLQQGISIGANLMGIAIVVIGVSAAAFMIKKAVDNIENDPAAATATAAELEAGGDMQNSSSQAALSVIPPVLADTNSSFMADRTASMKVTVKPLPAAIDGRAANAGNIERKTKSLTVVPASGTDAGHSAAAIPTPFTQAEDGSGIGVAEQNKIEAGQKPVASDIQLSANEYKVGFLGGISELQLSVTNPSAQPVKKVVVQIEYLKPNGKVVTRQTLEVAGLTPGATKTIPVPDNSRGVAVRYKVLHIES